MDNRSFNADAKSTPPPKLSVASKGFPTDGDIAQGQPATVPGARWFHQIGEELRAVIEAAGIYPNEQDLAQLLKALDSRYTSEKKLNDKFKYSADTGGYIWINSKVLFQWGQAYHSFTSDTEAERSLHTAYFPVRFPYRARHVFLQIELTSSSAHTDLLNNVGSTDVWAYTALGGGLSGSRSTFKYGFSLYGGHVRPFKIKYLAVGV